MTLLRRETVEYCAKLLMTNLFVQGKHYSVLQKRKLPDEFGHYTTHPLSPKVDPKALYEFIVRHWQEAKAGWEKQADKIMRCLGCGAAAKMREMRSCNIEAAARAHPGSLLEDFATTQFCFCKTCAVRDDHAAVIMDMIILHTYANSPDPAKREAVRERAEQILNSSRQRGFIEGMLREN